MTHFSSFSFSQFASVQKARNKKSFKYCGFTIHKARDSKNSISNNKLGFTLVELLISMALLSIMLILLTNIFASAVEVQLRNEATSSRQQDAQYILTRVAYDFNQATALTSPSSIGQQASTMTLTISGQSWTYSLVNGNLSLTNPQGTFLLNNYLTSVTQFSITRVGNAGGRPSVRLNVTVASRISGAAGNTPVSYSTTLVIR